ncbi:hypothetical protein [Arthrobacter sp. Soil763]|uniref:hypothetical protein n=1 Tax=Arthrobacter sp. Soil763 TaxID=1736402 RepID=UPI0006F8B64B|nr:hypothetical protein [Arthrobacter sp. Soil763]KRE79976.1 hypothetical protein ASG71_08045 [Arthrobacter sp. Soil763]
MSEVAIPQAAPVAAFNTSALPATAMTVSLMEWAQELSAAHQLGTALCSTEFVPASFRGKPEAAAAAILAGKSLGLDPMNALANIFVVSGRPSMYARTMAALVMQAGHTIRRVEATEQRVVYEGRRKGETTFTRVEWTIARAQKAGYTSNKKYQTDPIGMLTAKCQAEICRVIAPDVLTGIAATSVEEVELDDLGEQAPAAPAAEARPKRTIQRAKAPAPDLPDVVHDAPQDEAEAPAEPLATSAQLTKIHVILGKLGASDREAGLAELSTFTGRTIESSKALTKAEASRFIEEAETPPADADGVLPDVDGQWGLDQEGAK